MPLITLRDGQHLYTRVIGRGQPVLVLSGLGMESRHWLPFLAPFLRRYQFYIPDFRGFGFSSDTAFSTENDVFHSHMQDVEDVVTHFQLKDFLLIGYSLGASTSMHWMQYGNFSQQSIKRYLHIDQTPCIHHRDDWVYGLLGNQQTDFLDSLQQLLTILEHNPQIERIYELSLADRQLMLNIWGNTLATMLNKSLPRLILIFAPYSPLLFKHIINFSHAGYMRVYLRSYLQQRYDYRQAIANADVPITFFMGKQSQLYAVAGQQIIASLVKHPTTVVFEKSGHTPLFNEPVKFVKELGRFLRT